jgi:hypothetical protein
LAILEVLTLVKKHGINRLRLTEGLREILEEVILV